MGRARITKSQKSKEEIFWIVFDSVLKLDVVMGHYAWTISSLSRSSKISRPLIYYYFGNSKENILKTAVKFLGEEYFGLSEERLCLWEQRNILESILRSRRLCQRSPHALYFYFNRRNLNSEIGEQLRSYEQKHREKLIDYFPKKNQAHIEALSAVLLGLVVAPSLSDEALKTSLRVIQEKFSFDD